jgi:hypothetical protein
VLSVLEKVWRILELASDVFDFVEHWRFWLCVFGGATAFYVANRLGATLGDDAWVVGAAIGFLIGVVWELFDAARRRGYI